MKTSRVGGENKLLSVVNKTENRPQSSLNHSLVFQSGGELQQKANDTLQNSSNNNSTADLGALINSMNNNSKTNNNTCT